MDLQIKVEEVNNYRQSIALYKEKNDDLMTNLSLKENELLELRLQLGKQVNLNEAESSVSSQTRELLSSLQ